MRLTLRTILAYLDDVLEPAQARELGEKISESKEATDLVARIRDVVRRRRIGAPELAGPGSGPDPNVVSDYLENLLPPAQVVELERLCQASDLHLAEVAACHKVLSMVVGNPIDVSDEMRERMYGLGVARAGSEENSNGAIPAMAEGMSAVETNPDPGLPEYLTRRSFAQQYGSVLLVLLLTLFWLGLVWSDKALWTRHEPVAEIPAPATEVDAVAVRNAGAAANPNVAPDAARVAAPANPQTPATTVPLAVPGTVPVPTLPPAITPEEMAASPMATPATAASMPATTPLIPALPEPAVERLPESPLTYQSGDEFVIKKLATQPDWIVHPVDIPVEVGDELASPVPFKNTYSLSNVLDFELEPGSRVRRLPRSDSTDFGLDFNRGQVIFFRPLTTTEPVAMDLRIASQTWSITFLEPGTRVAVELIPQIPYGIPDMASQLPPTGGLVVTNGKIKISSKGQSEIELTPESGYARWPAKGDKLVLNADLGVPNWALPDNGLITPAAKQLSRLYQKEFIPDRTIAQCIGPVVGDRRAGISELAVKTLSLIDDYNYMTEALISDHQESRLAAIQSLRLWLNQDPETNKQLLREELSQHFREESLPTLEKLIWGISDRNAATPETSRQLIDWMKDDQIAIRQLAFEIVSRITGRTYDYLPMGPLQERRAAITRWEDFLKRNGGSLQPAESTPPTTPAPPAAQSPSATKSPPATPNSSETETKEMTPTAPASDSP